MAMEIAFFNVQPESPTTVPLKPTSTSSTDLSPKLNTLLSLLREKALECSPSEFRCIVFVEKRTTASAVSNAINHFAPILFPHVRSGYATGSNARGRIHKASKFGETKEIFENFRFGDINCVVATRVAEEGVDMYDLI